MDSLTCKSLLPPVVAVKQGETVAFEQLDVEGKWEWTLGTVASAHEHTMDLQIWEGSISGANDVKSALISQLNAEAAKSRALQSTIAASRDAITTATKKSDAAVSSSRAKYESARTAVKSIGQDDFSTALIAMKKHTQSLNVLKTVFEVSNPGCDLEDTYTLREVDEDITNGRFLSRLLTFKPTGRPHRRAEALLGLLQSSWTRDSVAKVFSSTGVLHDWLVATLTYQLSLYNRIHNHDIKQHDALSSRAIAELNDRNRKITDLKADLQKVTSNPRATVGARILAKSDTTRSIPIGGVITRLEVDSEATTIALSAGEVQQIESEASETRADLRKRFSALASDFVTVTSEWLPLNVYVRELEEDRMALHDQLLRIATQVGDQRMAGGADSTPVADVAHANAALDAMIKDLQFHDERWDSTEGPRVATPQKKTFVGDDWESVVTNKPEELLLTFLIDASHACHVPHQDVKDIRFVAAPSELCVSFSLTHPVSEGQDCINRRLSEGRFHSMEALYQNRYGPKKGLDKAVEAVCAAIGAPEKNFAGFFFDEFLEHLSDHDFLVDKDAYESEIGDLLMLLDKVNNENRSLQFALQKSTEEFRKQAARAQQEQELMRDRNAQMDDEITRLRDVIQQLKALVDKQENELEFYRFQQQQAAAIRAQRALSTLQVEEETPTYCVTLDELNEQKQIAETAQAQIAALQEQLRDMVDSTETVHDLATQCLTALIDEPNTLLTGRAPLPSSRHLESTVVQELADKVRDNLVQSEEILSTLLEKLEDQLTQLAEETQNLAQDLEEKTTALDALTAANAQITRDLEEANIKYNKLSDEYAALQAQKSEADAELHAFRQKRDEALAARAEEAALESHGEPLGEKARETAVDPEEIASAPLYAVTLEELNGVVAEKEKLAEALADKEAEAEQLTAEVAAHRAKRDEALAARAEEAALESHGEPLGEKARETAVDPEEIASAPLYAVTLEELNGVVAEKEKLAEALADKEAEAEQLTAEVAAHRAKRDEALAARAEEAALESHGEPLGEKARETAVDPEEIASAPLYAVTLEELNGVVAEKEKLAEALADKEAEAEQLTAEVAAHRAKRDEALAARAEEAALESHGEPLGEKARETAVDPEEIASAPLYAVTLEELNGVVAEKEKLAEALADKEAEAEQLTAEVAAHRAKRDEALAARAEEAALESHGEPLGEKARETAVDPEEIASAPLYAVTLEELNGVVAEKEKLAEALADKEAEAEQLTAEVAAHRAKRDEALAARAEEAALESHGEPLGEKARETAVDPEEIASAPLYAVTLEELNGVVAEKEKLAEALADKEAEAEQLTAEVAAHRAKRDEALAARAEEAALESHGEPLGEKARETAVDPEEIASAPLYAVTLEELNGVVAEKEKLAEALADKEAEAEQLTAEVAAHRAKRDEALAARAEEAALESHGEPLGEKARETAVDPEEIASAPLYAVTLEELNGVVAEKEKLAEALADKEAEAEQLTAEVAAHRAKRDEALAARAEEAALESHGEPLGEKARETAVDPEEIASAPLYAVTLEELNGVVAEKEKLAEALADKEAEAEQLTAEVAAHRAKRDEALAARAEEAALESHGEPLGEKARETAVDPEEIASAPLYAVTLEELNGVVAEKEKLAEALADKEAEAEQLTAEVAAHRAKRDEALAARAEEAALESHGEPLGEKARETAVDPEEIASAPLYAVTLEEHNDVVAEKEKLAEALADKEAEAEQLTAEVAAHRAKRDEALAARAEEAALESHGEPLGEKARETAVDPEEIASAPLYAVTLEELNGVVAEKEKLAEALADKEAEAEQLTAEVAAHRAKRDEALAARAEEAALESHGEPLGEKARETAVDPEEIASAPLYAVTLEEHNDVVAEKEKLAEALADKEAEAEQLTAEVAAHRAKRDEALAARAEEAALESHGEPLGEKARETAVDPEEIASAPLYAVTLDELLEERSTKDAELEVARQALADSVEECEKLRSSLADAEAAAQDADAARCDDYSALEAELLDLLVQLKALEGVNAAKDKIVEDLKLHDDRYKYEEAGGNTAKTSHSKVFEGDDWNLVLEGKPQALLDAFVSDASGACHVPRESIENVQFALGSLHATFDVLHAESVSETVLNKMIEECPFREVWALYDARQKPRGGLDKANEELDELRARAAELEEQVRELQSKLDEQGNQYRDTLGQLEDLVTQLEQAREGEKAALEDLEAREEELAELQRQREADQHKHEQDVEALEAELEDLRNEMQTHQDRELTDADKLKDLEEQLRKALEDLKAAQEKQEKVIATTRGILQAMQEENEKEVAALEKEHADAIDALQQELEQKNAELEAHRAKRDEALAARAEEAALESHGEPLGEKARETAVDPEEIASAPLYAVTLEELNGVVAEKEKLAEALADKEAEAEQLTAEVAAHRAKRDEALAARAEEAALESHGEPLGEKARETAVDPEEIASAPLYAVTLEELNGVVAEKEKLAEALADKEAEAEQLTAEVAAHRAKRDEALAARAEEAALESHGEPLGEKARETAVDPEEIASAPLYAVTVKELDEVVDRLQQLHADQEEAMRAFHHRVGDALRELGDKANAESGLAEKLLAVADALEEALAAEKTAKDQLADALKAREDVEEQYAAAKDENEKLRNLVEEQANALKAQKDAADANVDAMLKEIEDLKEKLRAAEDALGEKEAEMERLRAEQEEAMRAFQDRVGDALRELDEKSNSESGLPEKLLMVADALEEALASEKEAKDQLADALKSRGDLEEQHDQEREDNDKSRNLLEDQISALKAQKEAADANVDAMLKEIEDLKEKLRAAEDALGEKEAEMERLRAEQEEAMRAFQDRVGDALRELDDKANSESGLAEKLLAVADALEEALASEKVAKDQLADALVSREDVEEQYAAEKDENEKLRNLVEEQANALKAQKDAADANVDAMLKEIEDLKEKLRAAEDALGEKEAEMERLRAEQEEAMRAFQDRVGDALRELDEKSNAASGLPEKLLMVADALEDALAAEKVAKDQLADALKSRGDLEEQHDQEREDNDKSRNLLEDQVSALQAQKDAADANVDAMLKETEDLKEKLRAAEDALDEKEAEMDEVRAEQEAALRNFEDRIGDALRELQEKMTAQNGLAEKLSAVADALEDALASEKEAKDQLADAEKLHADAEVEREQEREDNERIRKLLADQVSTLQSKQLVANENQDEVLKEIEDLKEKLRASEDALVEKEAEMDRNAEEYNVALDGLNLRIEEMMEELDKRGEDNQKSLDKLEEFLGLLEAARAGEKAALQNLEMREQELFEVQDAREKDSDQNDRAMGLLQNQVEGLQNDVRDAHKQYDDLSAELAALRKALREARDTIIEKENEIEEMQIEFRATCDELNAQIDELTDELDAKSRECTDTLEKLEEFMGLVDTARAGEKSAFEKLGAREQELYDLQALRDNEKADYEATIAQLQKQIEALRNQRLTGDANHDEVLKEVDALQDEVNELKKSLQDKELENQRLQQNADAAEDAHQEQLAELEAQLDEKTAECTDNLEKLENFVGLLSGARSDHQTESDRANDLEQQVFELQSELDTARRESAHGIAVPENHPDNLRNERAADGATVDELVGKVDAAESRARDAEANADDKDRALDEAKAQHNAVVTQLQKIVATLMEALSSNHGVMNSTSGTLSEVCDMLPSVAYVR